MLTAVPNGELWAGTSRKDIEETQVKELVTSLFVAAGDASAPLLTISKFIRREKLDSLYPDLYLFSLT